MNRFIPGFIHELLKEVNYINIYNEEWKNGIEGLIKRNLGYLSRIESASIRDRSQLKADVFMVIGKEIQLQEKGARVI